MQHVSLWVSYKFVCLMVLNATFNNYIVAVNFIGGENHRHVARHRQTLSHIVVHLALIEIRTHNISGDMH